jgi:hypothetical protein
MRTVANFVKDMIDRGRTREQIRNVAAAGRWVDKMEEVAAECDRQFQAGKA